MNMGSSATATPPPSTNMLDNIMKATEKEKMKSKKK